MSKLKELKDLGISAVQFRRILAGRRAKPHILKTHITDKKFTFGVVSDTHLCSTEERLNELHTFYDICRRSGIRHIVHAGDLLSGDHVYKGQENEVKVFGAQKQVQYFINYYPKVKDIKTYYILGNHDIDFWLRAGVDIGTLIAEDRPDMEYLGQWSGDIVFGNVRVRLHHGDRGGSYAISYQSQKIIERLQPGKKPHIMIFGHWHTALYFFYRNVHVFHGGTFEGQGTLGVRMGSMPAIGGWTIKLHLGDEKTPIVSMTPTWIPFFEPSKSERILTTNQANPKPKDKQWRKKC